MAQVSIKGLTKRFGDDVVAVDDLSIEVSEGEFLTLLGPSGCGKTTTLRCAAGLETPDEGSITIGDQQVLSTTARTWVPPDKRDAGMVFQSYAVWPHMTVFSNVAYPLRMRRVARDAVRARVDEMLEALGLAPYADRLATELSGGQQQRVALARAMVAKPRVLLFDEPLSNLDAKLRAEMRVELRRLHEEFGTTSLYVTHDRTEAMVLSDRVAVMRDGEIRQLDGPEAVYTRPVERFVAGFVGFNNFVAGRVSEVRDDEVVAQTETGLALRGVRGSDRVAVGDDVVMAARSGSFQVTAEPPAQDVNVFDAKVVSSVYLGDAMQYRLSADLGELTADVDLFRVSPDAHGRYRWHVSDSVHVHLPPRWVVALPMTPHHPQKPPTPSRDEERDHEGEPT